MNLIRRIWNAPLGLRGILAGFAVPGVIFGTLIACGPGGDSNGNDGKIVSGLDNWRTQTITLQNGQTVYCVSVTGNDHNGIAIWCSASAG